MNFADKNCIFCKRDSTHSVSSEHIVPESLWNTQTVLPPGIVCDGCNNYFARKVEKPFLDSPSIRQLRFLENIPSKAGRVPPGFGVMQPGFPVEIVRPGKDIGDTALSIDLPCDASRYVTSRKTATVIVPTMWRLPEERVVSRLLAKMAIEVLALRVLNSPGGVAFVAAEPQLEPLRLFARRGTPQRWPFHSRRIYRSDRSLAAPNGTLLQTIHEFDLLYTAHNELYFIFALFGLELAINVGGPEIDGYVDWLKVNHGASPLYVGKNQDPGTTVSGSPINPSDRRMIAADAVSQKDS
jgi:hypothetical protein